VKITRLRTTPLVLPLRQPYVWAQGVHDAASVILVELESDTGLVGIGESVGTPTAAAIESMLHTVGRDLVGASPFDGSALLARAHQAHFDAAGATTPRFANRLFAGLEMALWDLAGKATGRPVHQLLGGALRAEVGYFAFLQGETAEALADDAAAAARSGARVIYVKIGRGDALDLRIVAAVREAIGRTRLRLDANEAWDPLTAIRMIRQLERYEPEFIEQPTPSGSIAALAHVKRSVGIPIAADQCVYTPGDVYEICRQQAADLIVLGLHEAGGIGGLRKAAAVAEAAGLNICLHGVFESGITTCASYQAALTLPNLDDGNQIMWQLLAHDLVDAPSLAPVAGRLTLPPAPGLGFSLDPARVKAATMGRER
jgi:muconate cycloisomerase